MRTPVYTKEGKHRIVSRPNGLWACQHSAIGKGHRSDYNTRDHWKDTHRDTTREQALGQLSAYGQIDN